MLCYVVLVTSLVLVLVGHSSTVLWYGERDVSREKSHLEDHTAHSPSSPSDLPQPQVWPVLCDCGILLALGWWGYYHLGSGGTTLHYHRGTNTPITIRHSTVRLHHRTEIHRPHLLYTTKTHIRDIRVISD